MKLYLELNGSTPEGGGQRHDNDAAVAHEIPGVLEGFEDRTNGFSWATNIYADVSWTLELSHFATSADFSFLHAAVQTIP